MIRETKSYKIGLILLTLSACGAPPSTKSAQGNRQVAIDCETDDKSEKALLLDEDEESSDSDDTCKPVSAKKATTKPATKNGSGSNSAVVQSPPAVAPQPAVVSPVPVNTGTGASSGGGGGLGRLLGGLGGGGGLGGLLGGLGGGGSQSQPAPSPAPASAPAASGGSVTYSANIAPYLQRACVGCHSYLGNYNGARGAANNSLSRMKSGKMPTSGRASDSEINQFQAWVSAGTPQ